MKIDDGIYPRKLRIALGNGLRPEIWEEFQKRFNIEKIIEFYGLTEGNFGFVNANGKVGSVGRYPWIIKKLLGPLEIVACDHDSGQPRRDQNGYCIVLPNGQTGLALTKISDAYPTGGYKGSKEINEEKIVRNIRKSGDMYFNTGDLLMVGEQDYVYFMDRVGDTFRWKGENVSTMEVSRVLCSFPAITEANVYGVYVPNREGRAGMGAIVVQEGAILDLHDLYTYVTSSLPDYACPTFLRVMDKMDITATFKHRKSDLVKQGFDLNTIDDELYIIEPSQMSYVPMTRKHLQIITAGQSKL